MISISHNGGLNAAAAGLAKGVEIGSQQALQKRALSQRDRALDMQKVESEAQIGLARDQEKRLAENADLSRKVQQENLAYTRQLRGEREQEGHALDLLDELRAAGDEYNAINAPADSPLSEDYVGPGSKQLEVIQKLSEAAKKLGPDAHRAVMQEKGKELAFTVLANGAKKQAQRIALLSGAGTPVSGVPLGILTPEQGNVLIQGMQQFIESEGAVGLNPIEVGQNLTKLEMEKAHESAYQAEGVRMLSNLTQQHAVTAQSHPGVPMVRSNAALALAGMRAPKTQEELDGLQSVYLKALSEDFAEASKLTEQRIRSQGRGNGAGMEPKPLTIEDRRQLRKDALGELAAEHTTDPEYKPSEAEIQERMNVIAGNPSPAAPADPKSGIAYQRAQKIQAALDKAYGGKPAPADIENAASELGRALADQNVPMDEIQQQVADFLAHNKLDPGERESSTKKPAYDPGMQNSVLNKPKQNKPAPHIRGAFQ